MTYNTRQYQQFAAVLATEREQNGASPALNRITAAITKLFADDNARFSRELFGKAARGHVPATTRLRPRSRSDRSEDLNGRPPGSPDECPACLNAEGRS